MRSRRSGKTRWRSSRRSGPAVLVWSSPRAHVDGRNVMRNCITFVVCDAEDDVLFAAAAAAFLVGGALCAPQPAHAADAADRRRDRRQRDRRGSLLRARHGLLQEGRPERRDTDAAERRGGRIGRCIGRAADRRFEHALARDRAPKGLAVRDFRAGRALLERDADDGARRIGRTARCKTAKDLSGKILAGVSLGGLDQLSLEAWLDKNGGDSAASKYVELAALADGGGARPRHRLGRQLARPRARCGRDRRDGPDHRQQLRQHREDVHDHRLVRDERLACEKSRRREEVSPPRWRKRPIGRTPITIVPPRSC